MIRWLTIHGALISACLGAHVTHLTASQVDGRDDDVPEGLRIPFGWESFSLGEEPRVLSWSRQSLPEGGNFRLRLAVALDIREDVHVEVRLTDSPEPLGDLDFRHAPVFQIAEIPVTRAQAESALSSGVSLKRLKGSAPVRFFAPGQDVPTVLQPHILAASEKADRWQQFEERLAGLDTIQTFSWMEGTLLDGIDDLSRARKSRPLWNAVETRLDLFLDGRNLIYEDPRSRPADNRIYGIEGTLPFAVIARRRPRHPSLDAATDFWTEGVKKDDFAAGAIIDGSSITTEGSYTVAYPMIVLGKLRRDHELIDLALEQYRVRRELLVDADGNIHQRNSNGRLDFRNWARGVTWYLLGLTRGLVELEGREDLDEFRAEARRAAEWVISRQNPDGLWHNFLHDPSSAVDTSGSAGIAAALAIGANAGIFPAEVRDAARRTLDGLETHLTPDGLITGSTPSNRASQGASNRRVIFPVAMGLGAQLVAALEKATDP